MGNFMRRSSSIAAVLGLIFGVAGQARAELIVTTTEAAFQANVTAGNASLATENFDSAAIGAKVVGPITIGGDGSIQNSSDNGFGFVGRFGDDQEIYSPNTSTLTLTFATAINQLSFDLFDLGTLGTTTFSVVLNNGDSATLGVELHGGGRE